jgi:hypothetical protein
VRRGHRLSERRQGAPRARGADPNSRAGGPSSAAGKAASAKNAFRRGLSLPLLADPAASAQVAALARAIAASAGIVGAPQSPSQTGVNALMVGAPGRPQGPPLHGTNTASELTELAHRVAEAQLDLVRVRRARHDLIAAALANPDEVFPGTQPTKARLLEAFAKLAKCPGPSQPFLEEIIAELRKTPHGAEKLALTIVELAPRLSAMDRYELARSRRKFAMRDFDMSRL